MANIVIHNTSYPFPGSWQELTLQQAQRVVEYAELCRDSRALVPGKRDESASLLLSDICGVPQEIAIQTDLDDRNHFAHRYCRLIMDSSADQYACYAGENDTFTGTDDITGPTRQNRHTDQQPHSHSQDKEFQNTFHWQGEWLRYPTSGTDINGDRMPMYNLSAIEFCEASDLYLADALSYAPLIVALLCRPAGERYSESRAQQRAQTMWMLPMKIALHVFELLDQTHRYLKELFPYCYATQGIHRQSKQPIDTRQISQMPSGQCSRAVSPPTWNDMLLEAAAYRPAEISAAEQMQLYDFMRLVNAKFKRHRLFHS